MAKLIAHQLAMASGISLGSNPVISKKYEMVNVNKVVASTSPPRKKLTFYSYTTLPPFKPKDSATFTPCV
jgi:hypothetical protein